MKRIVLTRSLAMSIFLDLIKAIIDYELSEWQKKSEGKDNGYLNKGLNLFGKGRNADLSQAKRTLAQTLIDTINNFKPLVNDQANLDAIKKLITTTQGLAENTSADKNHVQGTFEPTLEKLQGYIGAIFNKLNAVQLLDIQFNPKDPYTILCQHAARYFAQKVYEQKYGNKILNNPGYTNNPQLTRDKDTLLQEALKNCAKEISGMDKKSPYYQQARKRCVIEYLDHVIHENMTLCKKYGVTVKIPLMKFLYVKFQPMNPEVGYLEYSMAHAKEEVENIAVPMLSAKLALTHNTHSSEHWMGLIRAAVIKKLAKWKASSVAQDNSWLNTAATNMGVGRDLALSTYKQKLAQTLIDNLNKPGLCPNLIELEKTLTSFEQVASNESANKNYQDATFSDTITQCIILAKAIYTKLESIKLLNITNASDDPYEVFCYCAAEYFVRKVYISKNSHSLLDNPQITNKIALTSEKEKLLLTTIEDSAMDLAILDKNNPEYVTARQARMLKNANTLLEKNQQLCEKYGYDFGGVTDVGLGPVSLSTQSLGHKKGELDFYVKKAIKIIKDNKVQQPLMLPSVEVNTSSSVLISNYVNNTNNTNSINNTNASNMLPSQNNTNASSVAIPTNALIHQTIVHNTNTLFSHKMPIAETGLTIPIISMSTSVPENVGSMSYSTPSENVSLFLSGNIESEFQDVKENEEPEPDPDILKNEEESLEKQLTLF